jgi:hypothetical protein
VVHLYIMTFRTFFQRCKLGFADIIIGHVLFSVAVDAGDIIFAVAAQLPDCQISHFFLTRRVRHY